MQTTQIYADTTIFRELSKQIDNLPEKIKRDAYGAAFARIGAMAETRYKRVAAEHTKLPVQAIADNMNIVVRHAGDGITIHLKGHWIPLSALRPRQTKTGVTVRPRGSYRHAFIATMKSGHEGVFRRAKGVSRFPINKMFGPNPANHVRRKPEVYAGMLEELIESHMLKRVLHELDRRLPKGG